MVSNDDFEKLKKQTKKNAHVQNCNNELLQWQIEELAEKLIRTKKLARELKQSATILQRRNELLTKKLGDTEEQLTMMTYLALASAPDTLVTEAQRQQAYNDYMSLLEQQANKEAIGRIPHTPLTLVEKQQAYSYYMVSKRERVLKKIIESHDFKNLENDPYAQKK